MEVTYNDHPFDEVAKAAAEKIKQGFTVHQKFTCAGCGNRLTIDEPNVFHELGSCDNCKTITNIRKRGCNFLLISSRSR